jgi:hypothetical protein
MNNAGQRKRSAPTSKIKAPIVAIRLRTPSGILASSASIVKSV